MQDQAPKTATTETATTETATTETTTTETALPPGRSSVDKLPAELREAVNAAIAKGATIDDITALISEEGEGCSRSAVGRYSRNYRAMLRQQQESQRFMAQWMQAYGDRPQGQAGLILIETMREMAMDTMAALSAREEPVPMQELDRLTRVLKRIEDTDKLRLARERAAAEKEAEEAAEAEAAKAAAGAAKPKPRKGLSPEAEALIRSQVQRHRYPPEGPVNSVPIEPWNPAESHFVPPNLPSGPGGARDGGQSGSPAPAASAG